MADLSASETRSEYEEQKQVISQLRDRLADAEHQINEKEMLRRKLHNTILVNIFLEDNLYAFNMCFSISAKVLKHGSSWLNEFLIMLLLLGAVGIERKHPRILQSETTFARG